MDLNGSIQPILVYLLGRAKPLGFTEISKPACLWAELIRKLWFGLGQPQLRNRSHTTRQPSLTAATRNNVGRNLQKLLSFYDLQEILGFKVRIYSIKLSVSRKKLRGNYSDDYIVDFLNNELFFFFFGSKNWSLSWFMANNYPCSWMVFKDWVC